MGSQTGIAETNMNVQQSPELKCEQDLHSESGNGLLKGI